MALLVGGVCRGIGGCVGGAVGSGRVVGVLVVVGVALLVGVLVGRGRRRGVFVARCSVGVLLVVFVWRVGRGVRDRS